jgi:hypothetical protein
MVELCHGNHRRTGSREELQCGEHVFGCGERAGGLKESHGTEILFDVIERMPNDINRAGVISRQLHRPNERHLGAPRDRSIRYRGIVGRAYYARARMILGGSQRQPRRPTDEGNAGQKSQILAGEPFRATSCGYEKEGLHLREPPRFDVIMARITVDTPIITP